MFIIDFQQNIQNYISYILDLLPGKYVCICIYFIATLNKRVL
jgi:hypothetical protein